MVKQWRRWFARKRELRRVRKHASSAHRCDGQYREARRLAGRFASQGTVLRLYDQLRDR